MRLQSDRLTLISNNSAKLQLAKIFTLGVKVCWPQVTYPNWLNIFESEKTSKSLEISLLCSTHVENSAYTNHAKKRKNLIKKSSTLKSKMPIPMYIRKRLLIKQFKK